MSRSRPPNLLLILTDQHRLSAVGSYGPTPCRTPHLDQLAAESVRFENAYTVCPVCSPARASVLTGVFPHAHGMVSNTHNLGCSVHALTAYQDRLLSRRLIGAGYAAGYTGKWHLGDDRPLLFGGSTARFLPEDAGFVGQQLGGHGGGGHGYGEYRRYLEARGLQHRVRDWDEPTVRIRDAGVIDGPIEATEAFWLTEHTIGLSDRFRDDGRPWFIWHNFWGPHEPYYVTEEYLRLYDGVEIPPWPNYGWPARRIPGPHQAKLDPRSESLGWRDWSTMLRYYYAFTSMIDGQIGRLLEHLRRTGQLDHTVVVFAADHGETLGSHGGMTDKGFCHFEEVQRIPLIVRLPGGRGGGRVVRDLVSLIDLYPTLLDFAGASWNGAQGLSLRPAIEQGQPVPRDQVAVEFAGVNNVSYTMRTVRWSRYKYGFNIGGPDELYDLVADPHETRNLIDDPAHAAVADEGRRRLHRFMQETRDPTRDVYCFARGHLTRELMADSRWCRGAPPRLQPSLSPVRSTLEKEAKPWLVRP